MTPIIHRFDTALKRHYNGGILVSGVQVLADEKRCNKCGRSFPKTAEYFHRRGSGFVSECKECVSARLKKYHEEHRAERLEKLAAYREAHREEARRYHREVRDPDKKRASVRAAWAKHGAKYREAARRRYRANPKAWHARAARWMAAHPAYATHRSRIHSQRRRGVPPDAATQAYMRILAGDPCSYCGERPARIQVDHIIAVRRGGLSTVENLTAACRRCNQAKGNKSLFQFLLGRSNGE